MSLAVFTIGHSTHPAAQLHELLKRHNVTAVADVRSSPYSRLNPQFNRETLRQALKTLHSHYVFLGRELGARSEDPNCYIGGKVQYDRLAETSLFRAGLERVILGAKKYRVALLCAEKDPLTCHRCILVARHLVDQRVDVKHILASGTLESHADSLSRLLRELGLKERELFRGSNDIIAEAYKARGQEIAYVQTESAHEKTPGGLTR